MTTRTHPEKSNHRKTKIPILMVQRIILIWDTRIRTLTKVMDPEMPLDNDLALSAGESDLVVFWARCLGDDESLYGYTIVNAATTTSSVDFSTNGVALIDEEKFGEVDADWDPNLTPQMPRIVWTEEVIEDNNTILKVNAARVLLEEGQPSGISDRYVISDNVSDALNPTIVVNRFPGTEEEKEDAFEAFASYTEGLTAFRVDLEASNGVDNWQDPEDIVSGYGFYPEEMGVTYRVFGTPLHIWKKSGVIYTDNEALDDSNTVAAVKLYTGRKNNKDIFSSYKQEQGSNQKVIIRQLEP